jgi:hypothetical protein
MNTLLLADGWSPEATMNFWLITIPTILLAVVTVWANDRLAKVAMTAILLLAGKTKSRRKGRTTNNTVPPVVNVSVEVHGRHEAPDDEERHGFTFNRIDSDWDKGLANMTKGHIPEVWPHGEHTAN